jgi:putative FmdB family regulatory protein
MAIYEYQCEDCGSQFEARRAMKDADAPIACPACGGERSQRGLSVFFSNRASGGGAVGASSSSSCGSCSSHSCATCGSH